MRSEVRARSFLLLSSLILVLIPIFCRADAHNAETRLAARPLKIANASERIFIAYPRDGAVIGAAATFIVGAIPRGAGLTINGQPARVNGHGYFADVVRLNYGQNAFTLKLVDAEGGAQGSAQATIRVVRETPPPPISPSVFKIEQSSLEPSEDRGLIPGDVIQFSVRATPQATVEVELGEERIALYPSIALRQKQAAQQRARARGKGRATRPAQKSAPNAVAKPGPAVNLGMDVAYGQAFQRLPAARPDLYVGYYRINADDRWSGLTARAILTKGAQQTSARFAGRLTVLAQPFLAHTLHNNTIVRLGPGQARTTPIAEGVRVVVDGWQGKHVRCLYATNKHVWIQREDLSFDTYPAADGLFRQPALSGAYPSSVVRTVNTGQDAYGDLIALPLNQRLPYQVEQSVKPNRLALRVFGATADTDWISPSDVSPEGAQTSRETPSVAGCQLVEHISWRQVQDGIYELTAQLRGDRQWGFAVDYDQSTLRLRIKRPPQVGRGPRPLSGLRVCVDPGHGGKETGSIGCSGVPESRVNLDIALKFKQALEREGAQVIMTRLRDDEERSLDERVQQAVNAEADLLISVHNNALPDGRDPWKEHGTSSYFYQPQSVALARTLKDSVIDAVSFPDIGTRYQNLALCRPTAMPACLVEVGFMIHPDEYAQLLDPKVQERVAEGLLKGTALYVLGR